MPLSFGFHPYLALPGVARERWQVSLPARESSCWTSASCPPAPPGRAPAAHFVLGDRTFDDLFAVPAVTHALRVPAAAGA